MSIIIYHFKAIRSQLFKIRNESFIDVSHPNFETCNNYDTHRINIL